jgi:hypothetical protein
MDTFTKGPWKIELTASKTVNGTHCVAFVVGNGTNVADVCASYNISDDEAVANARLIAQAPALLEALHKAADVLRLYSVGKEGAAALAGERAARAAIAAARGSAP